MKLFKQTLFFFLIMSTMAHASKVDRLVKKSEQLISNINRLFGSNIILEIDNEKECQKFLFFMQFRPPGFEFKNNGHYAILCTQSLDHLIQLYPLNVAEAFHLFILAHESVHLLYGEKEVDQKISLFLKKMFPQDYGRDIDSSDLQHINIDILGMKILKFFEKDLKVQPEKFSSPFLHFAKVMELYQTDESLNKRLIFRNSLIKQSLEVPLSHWEDHIPVDSLCHRPGLHQGLAKLGLPISCFEEISEKEKTNLKKSFQQYLNEISKI